MNHYRAFGLHVASELLLPEFLPLEAALTDEQLSTPDVVVRFGAVREVRWSPGEGALHDAQVGEREAFFYWEPVGTLAALDGREAWIDPAPGASEELLRQPLLGAVFAALLEQRGDFVLHAGAMEIGGGAAVFMGWKGAGKSTMTASLFRRGNRLLSDDVVAIRLGEDGTMMVYPGFPQFKLWPESVQGALGEAAEALPELHGDTEKRSRVAFEGFAADPAPLRRIFVLDALPPEDDGEAIRIETLPPGQRVAQLIAHSYEARWGNAMLRGAAGAKHFQRCAQLAAQVPVLRLARRMDMELLPEVARRVEVEMGGVAVG